MHKLVSIDSIKFDDVKCHQLAIERVIPNTRTVMIVNNSDRELKHNLALLDKITYKLVTCHMSKNELNLIFENWISGVFEILIVKKMIYTCAILQDVIQRYSQMIILLRNVGYPEKILYLLKGIEANRNIAFVYIQRDIGFIYKNAELFMFENKNKNKNKNKRAQKEIIITCCKCNHCGLVVDNIQSKTCKCGNMLTKINRRLRSKLKIGIVINDFNPNNEKTISITSFHCLDDIIQSKKARRAKKGIQKFYFKHDSVSNMNYSKNTIVIYLHNYKNELTFFSKMPSGVCTKLQRILHMDNIGSEHLPFSSNTLLQINDDINQTIYSPGFIHDFDTDDYSLLYNRYLEVICVKFMIPGIFKKNYSSKRNSSLYNLACSLRNFYKEDAYDLKLIRSLINNYWDRFLYKIHNS